MTPRLKPLQVIEQRRKAVRRNTLIIVSIAAIVTSLALAAHKQTRTIAGLEKALKTQEKAFEQREERFYRTIDGIDQRIESIETTMQKIDYRRRLREYKLVQRGGHMIDRLDRYLAGSPLAGQGRTFYIAAVDAGIDPKLMPAIAMIESGAGRQNANTNNFFGRKAIGGGWMAWPTPEAAINNQAFYIARMWGKGANPYNMKGYCVPQFPWADKVAGQMARV